jgi:hypothetical protein
MHRVVPAITVPIVELNSECYAAFVLSPRNCASVHGSEFRSRAKNQKKGKFLHLLVPIISRNHQKRCNLAVEAGSLAVAMPSLAGAVKIASGKAAKDLKHDSQ